MLAEIRPTKKQLDNWIEQFVPEKDLFFIQEKDLSMFERDLYEVLIIPVNEFYKHPSYRQIQLANSYTYWNISSEAEFVIVAQSSWITKLAKHKKKDLLGIQGMMGRGLILPLAFFPYLSSNAQDYVIGDKEEQFVVLQYEMWNELPYDSKVNAIREYALLWDNWFCNEAPDYTPDHIRKHANQFSIVPGSNCLSATIFAITKQDWILDEWIHPETFKNGLDKANYSLTNGEFNMKKGDIVTWTNEDDVIQHAAFHIGDHLFFNKNGQTVFNPTKIVHWDHLNNQWDRYKKNRYRRKIE